MVVIILNFKENITSIPVYNDGIFEIYDIVQSNDVFPVEKIKSTGKSMYFEELSITDKLKFSAEERNINLTLKLRIPQTKELNTMNVLKIGNLYHKVYNVFHFTNAEGFRQTDLTLIEYKI